MSTCFMYIFIFTINVYMKALWFREEQVSTSLWLYRLFPVGSTVSEWNKTGLPSTRGPSFPLAQVQGEYK